MFVYCNGLVDGMVIYCNGVVDGLFVYCNGLVYGMVVCCRVLVDGLVMVMYYDWLVVIYDGMVDMPYKPWRQYKARHSKSETEVRILSEKCSKLKNGRPKERWYALTCVTPARGTALGLTSAAASAHMPICSSAYNICSSAASATSVINY